MLDRPSDPHVPNGDSSLAIYARPSEMIVSSTSQVALATKTLLYGVGRSGYVAHFGSYSAQVAPALRPSSKVASVAKRLGQPADEKPEHLLSSFDIYVSIKSQGPPPDVRLVLQGLQTKLHGHAIQGSTALMAIPHSGHLEPRP